VVREVLPVLDDFERALKAESSDADYRKGVELIYQRLLETIEKDRSRARRIARSGAVDPNLHRPWFRFETEEAPITCSRGVLEGYNFKGKLLRTAMVR